MQAELAWHLTCCSIFVGRNPVVGLALCRVVKHSAVGIIAWLVLCVGHDNKGDKPGWHLHLVEVTHLPTSRLYYFPCGRWLDKQQDDGLILRTLKVLKRSHSMDLSSLYYVRLSVTHGARRGNELLQGKTPACSNRLMDCRTAMPAAFFPTASLSCMTLVCGMTHA